MSILGDTTAMPSGVVAKLWWRGEPTVSVQFDPKRERMREENLRANGLWREREAQTSDSIGSTHE